MDIAKISAVEGELDNFISRRHEKRIQEEGERPAEEMWAESERRYEARRREENHAAWRRCHEDQAARHRATLETLATYHEGEAAKLQPEVAVVDGEEG